VPAKSKRFRPFFKETSAFANTVFVNCDLYFSGYSSNVLDLSNYQKNPKIVFQTASLHYSSRNILIPGFSARTNLQFSIVLCVQKNSW
jgi:hypothetical protein